MGKQLVVDLSGEITLESHTKAYLQDRDGTERVVVMSPWQAHTFSQAPSFQNPEIQKLLEITALSQQFHSRIIGVTDAFVLINTLGGISTILETLAWVKDATERNSGKMIGVVTQDAQSLGAMVAGMADEVLCLNDSRFLWHEARRDPMYGSLDEVAKVNGVSTEEQLRSVITRNRAAVLSLLVFLMRPGDQFPAHLRGKLLSSVYNDEDGFEEDLETAGMFSRKETTGFEIKDLYKPNWQFATTGRELGQLNLVTARDNVNELVREAREKGLNAGFSLNAPQDKFFVVARLNRTVSAQRLKLKFFIDAGGDISVICNESSPKIRNKNLKKAVAMISKLVGRVDTTSHLVSSDMV